MAAPAASTPSSSAPASSSSIAAPTPTAVAPASSAPTATANAAPSSNAPRNTAAPSPAPASKPSSNPAPAVASTSKRAASSSASQSNRPAGIPPPPQHRTLNVKDALMYLDDVKLSFTYKPEVYNQFLDIMKEFKSQTIDTPGVIDRVTNLFRGHSGLIQGFNTFLPPFFSIDCHGPDATYPEGSIEITTPLGTSRLRPGEKFDPPRAELRAATQLADKAADVALRKQREEYVRRYGPIPPSGATTPADSNPPPSNAGKSTAVGASAPKASTSKVTPQPSPASKQTGATTQPKGQPPVQASGSQAPAATTAQSSKQATIKATASEKAAPATEPAATSSTANLADPQARRTVPEFYHAVEFVNRIKRRFNDNNVTYNKFLKILQNYQIEHKTIPEVHDEVKALFKGGHEDLLQDFKQFLPDGSLPVGSSDAPGPSDTATGSLPAMDVPDAGTAASRVGRGAGQAAGRKIPAAELDVVDGNQQPAKRRKAAAGSQTEATAAAGRGRGSRRGRGASRAVVAQPNPLPPTIESRAAYADPVTGLAIDMQDSSVRTADYAPPVPVARPRAQINTSNGWYGADQQPTESHQSNGHVGKPRAQVTDEEAAFFTRLSNYIDDRPTYHEFLKLLNLYTQDIIDLFTLVSQARLFLEPFTDLWNEFRNMVGWKDGMTYQGGRVENGKWVIDNVPAQFYPDVRPDLRNAERSGPSYRKLPLSETPASSSGRDPLCWSVLNDEWVSQPSSLTEDGFVVSRKNEFETALHRTEEERYEYDYHIEANLRTIALLEPVAQRIAFMEPHEREIFRLKPGLGGQSKSLYQGIIKKVYGHEAGLHVISALHDNPVQSVPIVLARLKQKDEEWKRALREWNRIWRDADAKNFYKSLDHQGISIKAADKKGFSMKSFVNEIETAKREQMYRRLVKYSIKTDNTLPRRQLEFNLSDEDALFDVVKLFLAHLDRTTAAYTVKDRSNIEDFIREFIMLVFCIPLSEVKLMLEPPEMPKTTANANVNAEKAVEDAASEAGDLASDAGGNTSAAEEEAVVVPAAPARRGGKRVKGQNAGDLRRKALKKATGPGRKPHNHNAMAVNKDADDFMASSRESTPDVDMSAGSDFGTPELESSSAMVIDGAEEPYQKPVPATAAGLDAVAGVETVSTESAAQRIESLDETNSNADSADTPLAQARSASAAAPSGTNEEEIVVISHRTMTEPAAASSRHRFNFFCGSAHYTLLRMILVMQSRLALLKKASAEMYATQTEADSKTHRYPLSRFYHALTLVESLFDGKTDNNGFESAMRRVFGNHAYQLFTIDRCMATMTKLIFTFVDATHANSEVNTQLMTFLKADRIRPSTTSMEQLNFRTSAESAVGTEENLYRIEYIPSQRLVGFQLLGKDEILPEDEDAAYRNWQAYVKSYATSEQTEGVAHCNPVAPCLRRNLKYGNKGPAKSLQAASRMDMRVCMRSLRLFFVTEGEDFFFRLRRPAEISDEAARSKFALWLSKRMEQGGLSTTPAGTPTTTEAPATSLSPAVAKGALPVAKTPSNDKRQSPSAPRDVEMTGPPSSAANAPINAAVAPSTQV